MNCLIIEENPVTLLGYCSIINNNFPHWNINSSQSFCNAISFFESNNNVIIDFVLVGTKVADSFDDQGLSEFLRLSALKAYRCVVIVDSVHSSTLALCKKYNVLGVLLNGDSISNIVQAIRVVSCGGSYLHVTNRSVDNTATDYECAFTVRQKDVIDLLLLGYSNKKIARSLNLSDGTIKNYVFDIMKVLNVKSRLELALSIQHVRYQSSQHKMHFANDFKKLDEELVRM
jgi:DNA-binding NarL/FixJ family response regulator